MNPDSNNSNTSEPSTRKKPCSNSDLRSLIQHSFDGNRKQLSSFLQNCEIAFEHADENQYDFLLSYIRTQIIDTAQLACRIRSFKTFDELKAHLKQNFADTRTVMQLELELQKCRQQKGESVSEFMIRIETCAKEIKTVISHEENNERLLEGRFFSTDEQARTRFIIGLLPSLSEKIRNMNLNTLTEALKAATHEEGLVNLVEETNKTIMQSKPICQTCGKIGHVSTTCFKNKNNNVRKIYNFEQKNNYQKKFCSYCKKSGHLIDNCFKKDPSKRDKYLKDRKLNINSVSKGSNEPMWYVSTE
jgi:hypothetical protein